MLEVAVRLLKARHKINRRFAVAKRIVITVAYYKLVWPFGEVPASSECRSRQRQISAPMRSELEAPSESKEAGSAATSTFLSVGTLATLFHQTHLLAAPLWPYMLAFRFPYSKENDVLCN